MQPGEEIQVEAGDAHHRVVGEALVLNQEVGGSVPHKGEVVVRRAQGLEEGGAGGEERNVLNIGVVFLSLLAGCVNKERKMAYRLVGDQVVDVVAALPPSHGQTAAEVGDEEADEGVEGEVVGDGSVSGVVSSEHDLVL